MILVLQESNQSEKEVGSDKTDDNQSQLRGGSLVRYSKRSTTVLGNTLPRFLLRRVAPLTLSAAVGYGICYANLKGKIASMQREIISLEAFKKNAERDPTSKAFECSQYAAILVKDNGSIYEDLKKACMSSRK
jgi:hypothetical protein